MLVVLDRVSYLQLLLISFAWFAQDSLVHVLRLKGSEVILIYQTEFDMWIVKYFVYSKLSV